MGPARVGMDGAGVACSGAARAPVWQDHPGTVAACQDQGRGQTCGCEGCDQPGVSHDVARLFGTDDGPRTWESTEGWTNRIGPPIRGEAWNEPRYDAIEPDLPWLPEHRGDTRRAPLQTMAANVLVSPIGHTYAEDSSGSTVARPHRLRSGRPTPSSRDDGRKRVKPKPRYKEHGVPDDAVDRHVYTYSWVDSHGDVHVQGYYRDDDEDNKRDPWRPDDSGQLEGDPNVQVDELLAKAHRRLCLQVMDTFNKQCENLNELVDAGRDLAVGSAESAANMRAREAEKSKIGITKDAWIFAKCPGMLPDICYRNAPLDFGPAPGPKERGL